jgi:hypothetical protein
MKRQEKRRSEENRADGGKMLRVTIVAVLVPELFPPITVWWVRRWAWVYHFAIPS